MICPKCEGKVYQVSVRFKDDMVFPNQTFVDIITAHCPIDGDVNVEFAQVGRLIQPLSRLAMTYWNHNQR